MITISGKKPKHSLPRAILFFVALFITLSLLFLYSAGDGSFYPWAYKQSLRVVFGLVIFGMAAYVSTEFWYTYAYVFFALSIGLLVGVEFMGKIGMGAQRWLNLYFIQLQPSELARLSIIILLARYFCDNKTQTNKLSTFLWPLIFVGVPFLLIAKQPDLGTAMLILGSSGMLFLLGGIDLIKLSVTGLAAVCSFPVLWHFLRDYQKNRILIFLNPEMDVQKTGYHLQQSKIAIGSAGLWGKGFLEGTQSHLKFLPEKHTDFIFTLFAEEMGLFCSLILIGLYGAFIFYNYLVVLHERDMFKSLLVSGLTCTFFLYVFINIGMVTGIMPVVGVPLPFLSYGGTSLLTLLLSLGIIARVRMDQIARMR